MKILRITLLTLCILSLVVTIAMPLLSSYMQGYYKAQLDGTNTNEDAEELLNQKALWARIGETRIFSYIFLFFTCTAAVVQLPKWIRGWGNAERISE